MVCSCPLSAALPTLPAITCIEDFGQIQKVAFQRIFKADGSKNSFLATADMKLKASWTPLLVAADDTKVVISPYIQAPTTEPGAAREFGGGNETLGGVSIIVGREPSPFTGVFRGAPQSVIKILKTLQCENIGVYLFDENGAIGAIEDTTTAGKYYPIPIRSLFVSDKGFGGLEAPDTNNIQWMYLPNYSDDLKKVKPTDFNPLTDLVASL